MCAMVLKPDGECTSMRMPPAAALWAGRAQSEQFGEVLHYQIGLQFVSEVDQVSAAGDAAEGEDRAHADGFAAADVAFQIVADQQAPFRIDAEASAQLVEEDLLGLSAEDR